MGTVQPANHSTCRSTLRDLQAAHVCALQPDHTGPHWDPRTRKQWH